MAEWWNWQMRSTQNSVEATPVLAKGISRGDDAQRALDCGVAAIIVSNHGGRQLDTARPTIHALPEVVARAVQVGCQGFFEAQPDDKS
jgi:4-hydroxymandelate oxidase